MIVFVAIVLVIGVLAWAVVKSDELAGLTPRTTGPNRAYPHGAVVAASCEKAPEPASFAQAFRKALPWGMSALFALIAMAGAVCQQVGASVSPSEHSQVFFAGSVLMNAALSVLPPLGIALEAYFRAGEKGKLFANYVVILLLGAVLGALVWLAFDAVWLLADATGSAAWASPWRSALYAWGSIAGYMVGSALAVTRIGNRVTFVRTFADGHRDKVEVSDRSVAFRALSALAKK